MSDTFGTILIVVGLVFAGGVYSFVKQGLPKGVIALMSLGALLFIVSGVVRYLNNG